ncbi:asparagine synthase (glutamine-hydrolyzing) [Christensenella sp. MSJ-20]|uniref:asparagine synthase (glutamine-hydrolyzing) n=1 Tax=Christensenella sp. MSJ-20 TaxID=2841518 RepID=UPI001C7905E0|nr:asparagine synthase (glutamine-hydrolyzing) [Christensenella sp. MSJ-20]
MCGITGYLSPKGGELSVIEPMMEVITHRGPDSAGSHVDDKCALGFRRLSIIDLSADGDQPLYNEDRSLALVFNGEIYNYQRLKEDLLAKGHIFSTKTDSEVLLHGYEEWGLELLQKIRGMFGFCIWDYANDRALLVRDFFGIKPIYYGSFGGDFIFGSEIKSILQHPAVTRELNREALAQYLTFQYSVLPETFFRGIYRLPPAHYLLWEKGAFSIHRYWEPVFNADEPMTFEDAVNRIDAVMQDSIAAHKISDTEVGCFLSSGVDSSYIAAASHCDKTFTVGFANEQYDETSYAKELSEHIGVQNYRKIITPEEYWNILPTVQYHMDEPHADPSAVALYFVSQIASEKVKVVLSGEGSDELFGGYNIYREPHDLRPLTRLPRFIRKALGGLARCIPFRIKGKNYLIRGSMDLADRFIGNAKIFSVKERNRLLRNPMEVPVPQALTRPFYDKVKDQDEITQMQYIDINFWLWGDILLKADRMSMAHSLELRVPFLDKEVARVACSIPSRHRVTEGNTKAALRESAQRYIPQKSAQKKKLGFPVPIRVWLRQEPYYRIIKEAFTSAVAQELFNTQELLKLLDAHYHGKVDNSRKIWTIYTFLLWHGQFFPQAS